jgi:hypothetical protein
MSEKHVGCVVTYMVEFHKMSDEEGIKKFFDEAMKQNLSVNLTKLEATKSILCEGHKWTRTAKIS